MKIIIILFCVFISIYSLSFNQFSKTSSKFNKNLIFFQNKLIEQNFKKQNNFFKRIKRSNDFYKNYQKPTNSCYCKMKNLSSSYLLHNKINFICNCDKNNFNKYKNTYKSYKTDGSNRSNRVSYLRYHQALNENRNNRKYRNIDDYLKRKRKKKRYRSLSLNDKNFKKNSFKDQFFSKFDCSCDHKGCKGINCNDIKGCVCNENNKCWGNTCESIMLNHLNILKNQDGFSQNLNTYHENYKTNPNFDNRYFNEFNNPKFINDFNIQKFYNNLENQKLYSLDNSKYFHTFNDKLLDNFALTEKFYKTYDSLNSLSNFPKKNFFRDNNERFGSESKINFYDTNRVFNSQDLISTMVNKKNLKKNSRGVGSKKTMTFKNLILKEIVETIDNNENGLCNCLKGRCKGLECNNLNGCICDNQGCKGKFCKLIKNFYEHLNEEKNEENINSLQHVPNFQKEEEFPINKQVLPISADKIFSQSINNGFRNQHENIPNKLILETVYNKINDNQKNNEYYIPEEKNYLREQKNYVLNPKNFIPDHKNYMPEEKNYIREQKNYVLDPKNFIPDHKKYIPEQKIYLTEQINNEDKKIYLQEMKNTSIVSCEKNFEKNNTKPKLNLNKENNLVLKKEEDKALKTYEMKVIKLHPLTSANLLSNDSNELKRVDADEI